MRKVRCNNTAPTARVVLLRQDIGAVEDEVGERVCVHAVPVELLRAIINLRSVVLADARLAAAGLASATTAVSVAGRESEPVEEDPIARAVDVDIRPADDPLRPAHAALAVAAWAAGEVGVGVREVDVPWSRAGDGRAGSLPVGRLGLLHPDVHVDRVDEIVLVQRVVLERCPDQPGSLGALDERATPGSNDLLGTAVEGVVGRPAPHVLDIRGAGGLDVEHEERGLAGAGVRVGAGGVDLRVDGATDAEMRVPDTDVALGRAGHVDLHEDGAGEDLGDGEQHVADLRDTHVARVSDLQHHARVGGVLELGPDSADGRPDLTDDAGARWDGDRVRDHVDALGEVRDLAAGVREQGGVDSGGIVGRSVTLDALVLDVDELVRIVLLVLRLLHGEVLPVGAEQGRGAGGGVARAALVVAGVGVAHDPCVGDAAGEEGLPAVTLAHRGARVGADEVLDRQRALPVAGLVGVDDGPDGVGGGVDQADGAGGAVPAHVDTGAAVDERQALRGKEEDVRDGDGGVAAGELDVLERVLLVVESDTDGASSEGLQSRVSQSGLK